MRFVDADALKEKIEQCGGEGTMARYCKRVLAECLDNDAPTIDAIPVEWLKAQIRSYTGDVSDIGKSARNGTIKDLLRKWQKEQEARQ